MKRRVWFGGLLVAAAVGCSQNPPQPADAGKKEVPAPATAADQAALDAAVMAAKPANAISVKDAMNRPEGEKVVVTGQVPGGNLKPYNTALAAVVLMTPEDLEREKSEFDCEDAATCPSCKKILDKYSVQVEVVDQSGSPLPASLEGFRGLQKGSTITVEGTVQKYGKDKKLTRIVATKFFPG